MVWHFRFLMLLGLELRVCLLVRPSTTWARPQPFFCFSYFSLRFSHFCMGQASDYNSLTYITHVNHLAQFICWDGISTTFGLGWPRTMSLQISASLVAWIIGMRHCTDQNNTSNLNCHLAVWPKWYWSFFQGHMLKVAIILCGKDALLLPNLEWCYLFT
jgi:hypothetical protein